ATLYHSASDRVIIEMPKCRRLPFDFNNPGGDKPWQGQVPFEAFESNGTFPIRVTVDTDHLIGYFTMFGDASYGARGTGFATYNAGTGTRNLGDYTFYSH